MLRRFSVSGAPDSAELESQPRQSLWRHCPNRICAFSVFSSDQVGCSRASRTRLCMKTDECTHARKQASPAAARQSKATLEERDAGLHARAEALVMIVHPGGRRHVCRFQSAPLAEHRVFHAQRLGLFQVFLRGVTAVEDGVGRRFAIVFAMTFQHG